MPKEWLSSECYSCDCKTCKDDACALWRCYAICKENEKHKVVNCPNRAENNPDGDEEEEDE